MIPFFVVELEIGVFRKVVGQDQYRQKQKCDHHLQCWMQNIGHRAPAFFGAPRTSPRALSIGNTQACRSAKNNFFCSISVWEMLFALPITQKLYPETRRSHPATGWLLL